ncbi:hypothetical protein VNO77_44222 [Canavalia gladiata]|uniref:Uncharacterized protein n=1 Tax=Canavalia gladiata TaxID=3824 RepID=A0AAN9JZA1_CANGL
MVFLTKKKKKALGRGISSKILRGRRVVIEKKDSRERRGKEDSRSTFAALTHQYQFCTIVTNPSATTFEDSIRTALGIWIKASNLSLFGIGSAKWHRQASVRHEFCTIVTDSNAAKVQIQERQTTHGRKEKCSSPKQHACGIFIIMHATGFTWLPLFRPLPNCFKINTGNFMIQTGAYPGGQAPIYQPQRPCFDPQQASFTIFNKLNPIPPSHA